MSEFALQIWDFYGPMKLAIQAADKKGRPAAKVELIQPLNAPVLLLLRLISLKVKTVSPLSECLEKPMKVIGNWILSTVGGARSKKLQGQLWETPS